MHKVIKIRNLNLRTLTIEIIDHDQFFLMIMSFKSIDGIMIDQIWFI